MSTSIFIHKLVVLIILAIAANLDNLGVGIAYGMGSNRISNFSNFVIALLSGGLTFVAMIFGQWIQRILPVQLAESLGALVIVGVGIWVSYESAVNHILYLIRSRVIELFTELLPHFSRHRTKTQQTVPPRNTTHRTFRQNNFYVNFQETLILGVSLALNAMAGGFGASLAGHNAVIMSVAIGVFSYITIDLGQKLSKSYLSKSLGVWSQKVAGFLLILIGIYELFV